MNTDERKDTISNEVIASLEGMKVQVVDGVCNLEEFDYDANLWNPIGSHPFPVPDSILEEWLKAWNEHDRAAAVRLLTDQGTPSPRFDAESEEQEDIRELLKRLEKIREELCVVRWADRLPDNVSPMLETAEMRLCDAVDELTKRLDTKLEA